MNQIGQNQPVDPGADVIPLVRITEHTLLGDHHVYGSEDVPFQTRYKTATQRWTGGARNGAEFVTPTLRR